MCRPKCHHLRARICQHRNRFQIEFRLIFYFSPILFLMYWRGSMMCLSHLISVRCKRARLPTCVAEIDLPYFFVDWRDQLNGSGGDHVTLIQGHSKSKHTYTHTHAKTAWQLCDSSKPTFCMITWTKSQVTHTHSSATSMFCARVQRLTSKEVSFVLWSRSAVRSAQESVIGS